MSHQFCGFEQQPPIVLRQVRGAIIVGMAGRPGPTLHAPRTPPNPKPPGAIAAAGGSAAMMQKGTSFDPRLQIKYLKIKCCVVQNPEICLLSLDSPNKIK